MGFAWVRNHLYIPAEYIFQSNYINEDNILDLFEAYYFFADDAYLMQDYILANYYYQRCLYLATHDSNLWKEQIDWDELFDDLAVTFCLIGQKEIIKDLSTMSRKYNQKEIDIHFYDDIQKCDDELQHIRGLLCISRPDIIIKNYSDSFHEEIYLLTTIAYAQLGCDNIFYKRMSNPFLNVKLFTTEHAFYIPRPYYNRAEFWEILIRHFSHFNFGAVYSIANRDSIPTNIYLYYNYCRVLNNLHELTQLYKEYPQWKELEFLLQYYSIHSKMASWKELAIANLSPWD